MATTSLSKARAAKKKIAAMIADDPNVRGLGIAREDGGYSVKLNLAQPSSPDIPEEIDGVPVRVHVVGRIRKQTA